MPSTKYFLVKYKYKYFDISIYTKYSSTSSTDKYVLKYKYQVQVLYLTPTLLAMHAYVILLTVHNVFPAAIIYTTYHY